MSNPRLIARLDIKKHKLIKGIHLEGWRKVGDPQDYARRYYEQGADELLFMDVVASLYGRNTLLDIVEHTAKRIFVPLCVGGGVRSCDDARALLRAGADKVAVNTAATQRPELLTELAERFGAQCVVLSIEAKADGRGSWEALTDNGREHTHMDAVDWAARGAALGAGEILLTSVDRDGTRRGQDAALLQAVSERVACPVIYCGGVGTPQDVVAAFDTGADAVAMAAALHWDHMTIDDARAAARAHGLRVRAA